MKKGILILGLGLLLIALTGCAQQTSGDEGNDSTGVGFGAPTDPNKDDINSKTSQEDTARKQGYAGQTNKMKNLDTDPSDDEDSEDTGDDEDSEDTGDDEDSVTGENCPKGAVC